MAENFILTADVGTTALKICIFDDNLHILDTAKEEYQLIYTDEGFTEFVADEYWNIFCRCLKKCSFSMDRITKLVITTQGETIIPIEKNGNVLHNAVVWLDSRASAQAEIIRNTVDTAEFYRNTGISNCDGACPLCKLMWFKDNMPELYAKTDYFLLLEDYFIYRLSGRFVTESAIMSTTGYFSIWDNQIWDDMLEHNGLSKSKIPKVLECGCAVGKILDTVSAETGLSSRATVYTGAMDQVCAAVGIGNTKMGILSETTGTALVLGATTDRSVLTHSPFITVYRHAFPEKYLIMPICITGGIFLKWFKDEFCAEEKLIAERERRSVYSILDREAAESPCMSRGLITIPYLNGKLQPDFCPDAKGIFFGFSLEHKRADFIRSILESIGFMLKENAEDIQRRIPNKIERIYSCGGGSGSAVWSQIKADILGIEVCVSDNPELTSVGAALLVSEKKYTDITDKIFTDVYLPRNTNDYQIGYARYQELYNRIKILF